MAIKVMLYEGITRYYFINCHHYCVYEYYCYICNLYLCIEFINYNVSRFFFGS